MSPGYSVPCVRVTETPENPAGGGASADCTAVSVPALIYTRPDAITVSAAFIVTMRPSRIAVGPVSGSIGGLRAPVISLLHFFRLAVARCAVFFFADGACAAPASLAAFG